eukprot:58642_1
MRYAPPDPSHRIVSYRIGPFIHSPFTILIIEMVNYQKMNDETRRSYETAFGMNMNMDSLDLDLDLDDDDEQRSKSGHHYIGNSSSSSNSEKETELQKTASHEHHQHHQHHQHPLINKRPPRPYYQYPMNPSRSYA